MWTGSPAKRTSPESAGWMPAMHLISVDLPAPLSPTSAITSPAPTSKSTSVSACTEPKLFEMLFISSSGDGLDGRSAVRDFAGVSGVIVMGRESLRRAGGAPCQAPRPAPRGLAELRVLARADFGLLQEPVRDQQLPVVLRDGDRGQEHRRHLATAVERGLALGVDRLRVQDPVGDGRGRVGLGLDRLVDGHALPAGQDVLD